MRHMFFAGAAIAGLMTACHSAPNDHGASNGEASASTVEDLDPSVMEYSSVTLTIDKVVMEGSERGHTNVKAVFSTETAQEAILSQLDYYGKTHLLLGKAVREAIMAGDKVDGMYVWVKDLDQTQIVVDTGLYEKFADEAGTVLETHRAILANATAVIGKSDNGFIFVSE